MRIQVNNWRTKVTTSTAFFFVTFYNIKSSPVADGLQNICSEKFRNIKYSIFNIRNIHISQYTI